MRIRFWLMVLLLTLPASVFAQAVPGCAADGYLRDPRTYFYSLINRAPGQSARDWKEVLTPIGWATNPLPGERPGDNMYGITMQARGDGLVGRLFLPGERDPLGYLTAAVDYLTDVGGGVCRDWQGVEGPENTPTGRQYCAWAWIPRDGVYAPRQCGTAAPSPTPVPTPTPAPVPTPQPQPVPTPAPPIFTDASLKDLIARIDAFSANSTAEHNTIITKVDSPGWLERVIKHPLFTAAMGVVGGVVAKIQLD